MMKHLFIVAAATTALSGAALAADLRGPIREPVYVAPPPPVYAGYDWSGPYVGLNVGYGGGEQRFGYDYVDAYGNYQSGSDSHQNNGIVGGGQVGYNYAIGSSIFGGGSSCGGCGGGFGGVGLIVGAEADFDGSAIAGSAVVDSTSIYARVSSKLDYFGTVRGRLGVTFDRVMLFATGGFAYGKVSTDIKVPNDNIYDHYQHLNTGYVVGGGFEVAVTQNVMLRAEYLRLDFSGKMSSGNNPWMPYDLRERPIENIVRAGIDYKFDLFGPVAHPAVIARY